MIKKDLNIIFDNEKVLSLNNINSIKIAWDIIEIDTNDEYYLIRNFNYIKVNK